MRLTAYYPAKIRWDDETELEVEIKRLSFDEASEVRSRLRSLLDDSLRVLHLQKKGEPVSAEETFHKSEQLRRDVLESYARMKSRLVVERSDKSEKLVESGLDILNELGGNPDFIEAVYQKVIAQSRLSPKEKNDSSSPTDSKPSLGEPNQEAAGRKPEMTAERVENEDSASGEGATSPASVPSGSTSEPKSQSSLMNAPS